MDYFKLCADLTNLLSCNPNVTCKVGELLARFASEGNLTCHCLRGLNKFPLICLLLSESFRVQAGSSKIIPALLPFLSSSEMFTRLQILRAIGNLCIDNGNVMGNLCVVIVMSSSSDENRETVLLAGGCPGLAEQIGRCSNSSCEEYTNDRFKCVTCGCILNLATDNGE